MNGKTYELESLDLNNLHLADPTLSQMNGTTYGLESLGLKHLGRVYRNLSVPQLVERASAKGESSLAANGSLCVRTGKYTGRSPSDKFIVDESSIHSEVDWNRVNVPLAAEKFDLLYKRMLAYVQGRDLYVFDGYVGADQNHWLVQAKRTTNQGFIRSCNQTQ